MGESLALAMASGVRLNVNATAGVSESWSATVAANAVTMSPVRDQTGIRLSFAGVGALAGAPRIGDSRMIAVVKGVVNQKEQCLKMHLFGAS